MRDLFAREFMLDGVVVEENLKWREALFANRLGNVAPALVTLTTSKFVSHGLSDPNGSGYLCDLRENSAFFAVKVF